MTSSGVADLDFIEELKLRRWARENYVPEEERSEGWHPVIIEEMERKDKESGDLLPVPTYAWTAN